MEYVDNTLRTFKDVTLDKLSCVRKHIIYIKDRGLLGDMWKTSLLNIIYMYNICSSDVIDDCDELDVFECIDIVEKYIISEVVICGSKRILGSDSINKLYLKTLEDTPMNKVDDITEDVLIEKLTYKEFSEYAKKKVRW